MGMIKSNMLKEGLIREVLERGFLHINKNMKDIPEYYGPEVKKTEYNFFIDFFLTDKNIIDILKNPDYLPDNVKKHFDTICNEINKSVKIFERNTQSCCKVFPRTIYYVSYLYPLTIKSSKGFIFTLRVEKQNKRSVYTLGCEWSLKKI